MKTAVSIPDKIFKSAESLARKRGQSRSQLYAQALHNYLAEQKDQEVTDRLNNAFAHNSNQLDEPLQQMQMRSLTKGQW